MLVFFSDTAVEDRAIHATTTEFGDPIEIVPITAEEKTGKF